MDLEDRFVESCRRRRLVKYFRHWVGQAIQRAEWVEACRQSDIYKQKVQLQRSATAAPSEKKRQMELSPTPESPIRKRARKRVSSVYQPPRTDEQLAQRLKEVRIPYKANDICDLPFFFFFKILEPGGEPASVGSWIVPRGAPRSRARDERLIAVF